MAVLKLIIETSYHPEGKGDLLNSLCIAKVHIKYIYDNIINAFSSLTGS